MQTNPILIPVIGIVSMLSLTTLISEAQSPKNQAPLNISINLTGSDLDIKSAIFRCPIVFIGRILNTGIDENGPALEAVPELIMEALKLMFRKFSVVHLRQQLQSIFL